MKPMPFTRFCSDVLRIQLTAGQRVLCLVAFDGVEPEQLEGTDRELARQIFGDVDVIPPAARHVLAAMCGARGGKSYVLGALRLLHLALTVSLKSLAPGEQAFGLIVAPDLRLSRQTIRYVLGAVKATPSIAKLLIGETADSVTLQRPDGRVVVIECLPATRGGSAVRGRSLFGAVLDEAAFFRDDNFLVNDIEIYKAISPRVMPGGQLVIASTPWTESGLLYDLFEANRGEPKTAISAHAPTVLLRDDAHTRELVERERLRDPENARREFDAEPVSGGASAFFDPAAIKACIVEDDRLIVPPPNTFDSAFGGLDTAFKRDASAIVVVRATGPRREHLDVAECAEITPPKGGRLIPSVTIKQLLERAQYHRCRTVVADQHYIETVREHTRGFRVSLIEAPGGLSGKVECYLAARNALSEGRVRIPKNNHKLISQLRDVVKKPSSGGGISISSPRRAGSHGDIASAFVLAVWSGWQVRGSDGAVRGEVVRTEMTRALNTTDLRDELRHRCRVREAEEFRAQGIRMRVPRRPRGVFG